MKFNFAFCLIIKFCEILFFVYIYDIIKRFDIMVLLYYYGACFRKKKQKYKKIIIQYRGGIFVEITSKGINFHKNK